MMTEQKLWQTLQRQLPSVPGLKLNRMECSTLLGVSDLEYVGSKAHGWVELKVGYPPQRSNRPLRLGAAFTTEQSIWLLDHHRPRIRLLSWLLIGIPSRHADCWQSFALAPPDLAASLVSNTCTWGGLRSLGVELWPTAKAALTIIDKGG